MVHLIICNIVALALIVLILILTSFKDKKMISNFRFSPKILNLSVIFGLASLVVTTEVAASGRYIVDGERLHFDMNVENSEYELAHGLAPDDAAVFGAYIMDFPEITTLVISGVGGSSRAAYRIAEIVESNRLDTIAQGRCLSACATIFLAGQNRYLARGATLGFHAPYLNPEGERTFFDRNRERRGWNDVFDYVPSVYSLGVSAALRRFKYFLERGVDIEFIIESLDTAPDEILEPTRERLFKAGVLTTMIAPPDKEF